MKWKCNTHEKYIIYRGLQQLSVLLLLLFFILNLNFILFYLFKFKQGFNLKKNVKLTLNTHMLPIYPTHIAIQSTSKGVKLKETCQGTDCIQIFLFGPLRMNALRSWDLGAKKLGVTECQRLCVRFLNWKDRECEKWRKNLYECVSSHDISRNLRYVSWTGIKRSRK
jgi:hypothetical protein